ncbi:MAG: DUF2884 family protein [Kangiellaceae bacterium]|nr:DUF2884 family protein [Kangiellaceae bacterium]
MKSKLKTIALSVMLATGAGVASAHNVSCDVDMAYDIDLDGQKITLSDNKAEKVVITGSNELYLNGDKQSLSSEQRELLGAYAKDIRELLPAATEVAEEATSLALEAVRDVTATLLHDNPEKAEKFVSRVDSIAAGIKQHISDNHLRPNGIEEYFEGSEFEKEFEELIEDTVVDFVQGNIGEIVAAAMRGDDDKVNTFEKRMEKFGEEMETKFEAKGELIEKKAEALCQLVEQIDEKEDVFVKAFDKYEKYQLVTE